MSADPDGWTYYKRALQLKCPECGNAPIFKPFSETHSMSEWMQPLDGCPHCDYHYEREPGYFLLSTWALNYGVVGGLGLLVALMVEWTWHPPFWQTMLCVAGPVILSNILFVRLSKALFIAFDHIVDPEYKQIERKQRESGLKPVAAK